MNEDIGAAAPKRKAYAKGTRTSIASTEIDIKKLLQREGAEAVAIMEERSRAIVAFRLRDRNIRFNLPLPQRDQFSRSRRFQGWQENPEKTIDNLWVQASRERWRQLHLCIKAKLEAIAQEIETFDEAFLPHVVMPDGRTIGEHVIENMKAQLSGAPSTPLLPPPDRA